MPPELQNTPQEGQSAPQEASKKERLQALESELQQSLASLESDFAKKCATLCEKNPELEELFFEDKEAFFLKILQYQNEVITQEIAPKEQMVENLKGEIAFDDKLSALQAAKLEFEKQNPQIDTNELLMLFAQLPPEAQSELENLPSQEVFPTLLSIMQAKQSQGAQSNDELPKQVSGAPANVSTNEVQNDLPTQRI